MIPVYSQISFGTHYFFLFERICYELEKKRLARSYRIKRSDGLWFSSTSKCFCSSLYNFFEDFKQFFRRITAFPGVPRPPQLFMKIPRFSRIWPLWLFNHFSVRCPNLKPCKTQDSSQKQYTK